MIRPNKIKEDASVATICPIRRKVKRHCTEGSSLLSPFFRPKKLGKFAKSVTGVLDLALLTPTRETDLAIHRMKLEEIKKWLRSTMAINRGPKTLLLTGPSGSGKTSALRVLCAELGIEVNEFDCTEEFGAALPFSEGPSCSKRNGDSQGFYQFLRSNEFSSIQNMSLKHRLLLIAQLPNAFYRDPSNFHSFLATVMPSSRCLIVFVLANVDSCWEFSPFRLFPSSVVEHLQITHIKFNPIADSLLTAAIKRIFRLVDLRWDAELVKQIVICANGDIRRALNALLFSLIKIDNLKKIGIGARHPSQLSGEKSLELFHFIGKILYAKRVEEKNGAKNIELEQWKRTEQKLSRKAREKCGRPFPPKDDLNQLIAAAPIGGQCLVGFIYEHEARFAPSLSALAKMNSTIAFVDVMNRQFGVESERIADKYIMEIAVRASLFHNYRSAVEKASFRQTFYHFEKPRFCEMDAQRHDQRLRMAQVIGMERTAQMETLIVPLLSHLRARGFANADQQQTLGRLGPAFNASQSANAFSVLSRPPSDVIPTFGTDDGQNYEIDESEDGSEEYRRSAPFGRVAGFHR